MPNWIEGSLKLRGTAENLKRFFETGIDCPGNFNNENKNDYVSIYEYDDGDCLISLTKDAYIKNTKRAFVSSSCEEVLYKDESPLVICIPIQQAWNFVPEDWEDLSVKYNLDIRLYGFERGAQFCSELEIINGVTSICKTIEYDDYEWECPMPMLGG